MVFHFTTKDEHHSLHPNIKTYMQVFVKHRFLALEKLKTAVASEDIEGIRDFCHKQIGVAASYKCYRLEEITKYIQKHARKTELEPIKEILPVFEEYLKQLQADL
ncbi:MAG: hypothetical protein QF441_01055 [Bacteriovoracaceae bacterium]|jgi:hypothetical protein|nr:hypothetical protein [Halobacteriovoraceae bacterium]MDP7319158.1 hypothetical protein [Bacteriovoracaceae bacterium]|tara:strand:+ start:426 stop:740 length:315 start_codon:yes stop_codon:yes gene_type:complete